MLISKLNQRTPENQRNPMSTLRIFSLFLTAFLFGLSSCTSGEDGGDQGSSNQHDGTHAHDDDSMHSGAITLTPLTESPKYPEATLALNAPDGSAASGTISFDFDVDGYELGTQTADAEGKGLANSGKGQHIHLILNNGPYSAHYEPDFDKELDDGNYVMLAFLSRSYHESVKNGSAVVSQFTVGEVEADTADLSAPHLFYSRPKGTYTGADIENVLLDFYPVNVELSPEGYKVRATINGEAFTLDTWQPYLIGGAEPGEMIVKLELLDAAGELVPGPFNVVERSVTLQEEAH